MTTTHGARVEMRRDAPDLYRAQAAFDRAVRESALDTALYELVKIRASQLNGCAYCIDMHTRQARADGEAAPPTAHGRRGGGATRAHRPGRQRARAARVALARGRRRVRAHRRRRRVRGGNRRRRRPGPVRLRPGRWFDQPGSYYWQVDRVGADGSCSATDVRQVTLTSALPVAPALANLSRERIPRRIGASNGATFQIRTSGMPAGVSSARFLALVRNGARRWRLHSLGTRPGEPRFGNGPRGCLDTPMVVGLARGE